MINKQALDKVVNGEPEERVYLCDKEFQLFMMYYFLHYLKYKFAPFHKEMFQDLKDLLSGKYREIAWIMFRESAKTSITKIFIIYLIVYKKRKYINTDSFDKENAERLLFDVVHELQSNKRLIADFGQLYNVKRTDDQVTQKRVSNFVTNNGVRVEAHSTQESVRGRIHGEQRPDCFILDDIETNKTKDSKAYTEQVIKHIDELKAGLAPDAIVIYLGNYITELGSIQSLIDRAVTDDRLKVRMVGVLTEHGQPSWPDKYVLDNPLVGELEEGKVSIEDKKKQLGSSVFSAEMLNQPIDAESQEFRKVMFRYRTEEELRDIRSNRYLTVDTAISEKSSADYTGMVDNRVDAKNKWNLKAWRVKVNPKDLIDMLFTLHANNNYTEIGIEKTIYLQAIQPFLQDEMAKRNNFLPIVELKHNQINKETRIRGLLPRYGNLGIYHIEGQCNDLEDELLRFPRAVHDDISDALAYQLQIAQPPNTDELEMMYAHTRQSGANKKNEAR